jgi:WhiB family transcriptional regulator, redox-sensing transcriptional regulator
MTGPINALDVTALARTAGTPPGGNGPTQAQALRQLRGKLQEEEQKSGTASTEDVQDETTEGERTGRYLLDDLLDKAEQALREKLDPKITEIEIGSSRGTGDAQLDDLLEKADAALRTATVITKQPTLSLLEKSSAPVGDRTVADAQPLTTRPDLADPLVPATAPRRKRMLTATISLEALDGGTLPDLLGRAGLAHLLNTVPSGSEALPCRSHDNPDLWFAESPAELEQAKHLCNECLIKLACLNSALSRQEPWGVWGGEIFEDGAVIPRKRPHSRPSKAATDRERAEQERAERERTRRSTA